MCKRTCSMSALAMAALFPLANVASAADAVPLERWRSYAA